MAKSDSFFIRQSVITDGVNFVQQAIDLGAFVDALGRSVLKIHNVSVQYMDESSMTPFGVAANDVTLTRWQLTTQSQSAIIRDDNRSVISSGSLTLMNGSSTAGKLTAMDDTIDINPEAWKNGYTVAVEAIYLGTNLAGTPTSGNMACTLVLECTSESLTREGAMALALSQQ